MDSVAVKEEGGWEIKVPPPPFCDPKDPDCCGGDGSGEDDSVNDKGKLKSSCEKCSVAKVKCSGEIPCERCTRRGLECEYKMEKKRGRRTVAKTKKLVCSDSSCWGQVVMNPIHKCEDFGAKFGLESVERRVFQTFFAIYKHHATPQSCCREWFTYQLNKMSTFLLSHGNKAGQEKLDNWMRKKGVEVLPHNPKEYAKIPANMVDDVTGKKLPPIHPMKGPRMGMDDSGVASAKRKRNKGAQVYSTKGFYRDDIVNSPIDREIESMRTNMCYLNLRATHEQFEVEVNEEFTALFGYTARSIIIVLERLFGGLLPWGCDVLALLLANDFDLLFFLRILALKFNNIGRPAKFPATRQALSTHQFEFETRNGDIVECVMKCIHREYLSLEKTEVDIFFGFDPVFPDVPRLFRGVQPSEKRRMVSSAGQDSAGPSDLPMTPFRQIQESPGMESFDSIAEDEYEDREGSGSSGSDSAMASPEPSDSTTPFESAATFLPPNAAPYSYPSGKRPYVTQYSSMDYPSSNLEGLDFLDSMMNWAEGDAPSDFSNNYDNTVLDVAGPLGNMSIGNLSTVSESYAPSLGMRGDQMSMDIPPHQINGNRTT